MTPDQSTLCFPILLQIVVTSQRYLNSLKGLSGVCDSASFSSLCRHAYGYSIVSICTVEELFRINIFHKDRFQREPIDYHFTSPSKLYTNLRIQIEPVRIVADAKVYAWFLCKECCTVCRKKLGIFSFISTWGNRLAFKVFIQITFGTVCLPTVR